MKIGIVGTPDNATKLFQDLLDLFLGENFKGFPIAEIYSECQLVEKGWIHKAIKHPNKLRQDLGLEKNQNIYDIPVSKVMDYARKSLDNYRRVVLLRTLLKNRPAPRTQKEIEFYKKLCDELEDYKDERNN